MEGRLPRIMDGTTALERVLVDVRDVAAEGEGLPQLGERSRAGGDLAFSAARALAAHLAVDQPEPASPALGPYWLCVRAAGGALVIASRFHATITTAAASKGRDRLRVAATVVEADPQIIATPEVNAGSLAYRLSMVCEMLAKPDWSEHPQSGDALGALAIPVAVAAIGLAQAHEREEL